MTRENERYIPYNVCDTPPAHVATLFPYSLMSTGTETGEGSSEYGYDLYDVEVSRDYNGMAVLMTLRAILAAYLCGECD